MAAVTTKKKGRPGKSGWYITKTYMKTRIEEVLDVQESQMGWKETSDMCVMFPLHSSSAFVPMTMIRLVIDIGMSGSKI